MAWSELVNDRYHFWMVRQALHDFTYVAIVCHVDNPSRVESVSKVDFHKLSTAPCRPYHHSVGLFLSRGGLTIIDLL